MKYLKTYNESVEAKIDLSILTDILYELSDNHTEVNVKGFSNFVKIESSLHDNNQIKDEINSLIKRSLKYYHQETGLSLEASIHKKNLEYFYSPIYYDDNGISREVKKTSKPDKILYIYFSIKSDKPNVFSNQSLNFKIDESKLTNILSEEDINDIKDIFKI